MKNNFWGNILVVIFYILFAILFVGMWVLALS